MLQRKSSRSYTSTSKRSQRRLKLSIQFFRKYIRVIPFAIFLVFILYFLSRAFIVRQIKCQTNSRTCSREVEGILYHLEDKNFFTINKKELEWAIKQIFPIDSIGYNFTYPNTLTVSLSGIQEAFSLLTYQSATLPTLSLDAFESSTDSGQWARPVPEIESFIAKLDGKPQKLWERGQFTPDTESSDKISFIYSSLPKETQITAIFKIIALVNKYLDSPRIVIFGDRIFLSSPNLPDIIIYIDSDIKNVETSLQSLDYLVTIKQDAKVLNLSFKHPIIK